MDAELVDLFYPMPVMDSDPRPFIGDPFQDPAAAYLLVEAKAPAVYPVARAGKASDKQAAEPVEEVVYPAA